MRTPRVGFAAFVVAAFAVTGAVQAGQAPAANPDKAPTRTVDRSECFASGELPPELQARSEALLLEMLDSEVLYTLVGGLKPVSCRNIYKLRFIEDWPKEPTPEFLAAAEEQRRLMSPWRCGEILGVYVFAHPKRASLCDTYFYNRPVVSEVVRRHEAHFAALGLTPTSDPIEIVMTDHEDDDRSVGYLFGYPDYAVDYYADVAVPHLKKTNTWPDMDLVEIPTFGRMVARRTKAEMFRFHWSVPKGHVENDADRAIKARAARIFSEYKERRARYIGPGKPGAFALLRDWYCDSHGRCAVEHAGHDAPSASAKP
jgi:hypothetical protein